MPETIMETIANSDVIGSTNRIVDLIADLQAVLERIPEEFRGEATIEIDAYDWEGSYVQYVRPITDAEIAARVESIEAQRRRAAKAAENRQTEEWLRNIRIGARIPDRDEAMEFLKTNPDANQYHPDVYRTGNHGHA